MSGDAGASETSEELSVVCQSDIVFCHPGDEAVLSCHLKPAISAVSMDIRWWNKQELVFHYKNGQVLVNIDYKGQANLPLQDLHKGNVSLTLRDVRKSQTGLYICEVTHKKHTIQDTVFLHISSEDFTVVVPAGPVSADPGGDVILPAHLSPEASAVSMDIRWFRATELIYQYRNGEEILNNDFEGQVDLSMQELQRGNLSLTLRNAQLSDSGIYTCRVFHNVCLKTEVVHLQVRDIKRDRDTQRLNHLRGVLRRAHEDIAKQTVIQAETLKLLEETLNEDPSSRRSMEGILPLMESERDGATSEGLSSTHTSSQVLQRQRASECMVLKEKPTQTQQSVAAEQRRSSSALQSQAQERERTSVTTQTERPEDATQRRHENTKKKCHIL